MIEIRNIQSKDFFEAGVMIRETIRAATGNEHPTKLVKAFCARYELDKFKVKAKKIQHFVAIDTANNRIVGIIGKKDNELRTFFVHPKYQGRSIGTKLFNRLKKEMIQKDVQKIVTIGTKIGDPIYEHFGFIKTGSITNELDGIPFENSIMEKVLITKKKNAVQRKLFYVAIIILLLLIWAELGVGIFGTPFAGS